MRFDIFSKDRAVWCPRNVEKAAERFERKVLVDKIAFLVMNSVTLKNWRSFLKFIPKNMFDVLYPYEYNTPYMKSEHVNILAHCKENGYNAKNLLAVLEGNKSYKMAVSANLWFNDYGRIDTLISPRHSRMIYSLGASNEVLSLKKNAVYDEIYCYGAYQRDKLRVLPSTRIFTVGNPRFDFLFDGSTSKEYIRQKLGITGNKNVLAWFPTMSGFCSSIGVWDEQIDSLADEYDIFVCPHMFTSEDAIAKLSEKRVRILPNCFSAELMFVADYCLCDYGGAAFSTIYLDNNLILLNVDGVDECRIYGEDSPEFFLRKKLKSYDLGSVDWLRRDLKDKAYWEDQKKVRRELFDKFYSDYRGNTGVYVYKLLRESFHSVR